MIWNKKKRLNINLNRIGRKNATTWTVNFNSPFFLPFNQFKGQGSFNIKNEEQTRY